MFYKKDKTVFSYQTYLFTFFYSEEQKTIIKNSYQTGLKLLWRKKSNIFNKMLFLIKSNKFLPFNFVDKKILFYYIFNSFVK